MSIRSDRLMELQQLDLIIDAKNEELSRVESQLCETEELIAARETVRLEKERRQQLEKTMRSLEWEADDLAEKIAPLEEKLYSGRVKIAKELSGLQHEVEGLKTKRRATEDRQLDIMTELDESVPVLKQKEEELAEAEAAWRADQERLLAEKNHLTSEIEVTTEKKQSVLKLIPPSDLDLYGELRESKRGRAVARIEKGMCQGCRITLSMNEIQKVRVSSAPTRCSSCGRILVA